jgi:hypothetical protein
MHISERWAEHVSPRRTSATRRGAAVSPDSYLLLVSAILAVVVAVNLVAIYGWHTSESGRVRQVARLFLLDAESNFATLFNFSLIALNAALLGLVGLAAFQERDRWRWHWTVLALVFLLLAYDEAASFHERLMPLGRALVGGEGLLFFSWVVFGAGFVLLVGLAYLRFVLALPRRTGTLFVLAGALYVGGALGIELWGGHFASANGMDNIGFHLIATVEETLEIAGQIVFGYALLGHIVERDAEPG